ncbi:type VI secretion system tube protein Hcp [Luteolibacter yonseiensis]|uniref:Type VI secretion system tube protein Hcp n=1 Tax=Luteolibacter yonseiensis TaxID=1144680 RepID=A0A934QZY4_9BACT|nr:type VI secretion system tube protein Hcp [Luteolibacter yonseiensis]MBK1815838.1 type VI secretion system tube protein Hcp [Luteolibacter yonseiensis]
MKQNPSLSKTLALVAPATLLSISSTFGASDYYLKIEGIKGESVDSRHKDWIELDSFSWGVSNASLAGSGSGGMGTGKVSMQDFHFTMKVDKASPKLMLACATGKHIPSLQFAVSRMDGASGGTTDYYVITLTDVLVSSYQSNSPQPTAGSPAGPLTASVSFNFTKIKWDYIAPDKEVVSIEHDASSTAPD